jgi:ribosome-associated toxin RatA of RatAB toxin-antitoxin module
MEMDLVMGPRGRQPAAAGRTFARWLLFCLALIATGSATTANPLDESRVDVRETGGLYRVTAAFAVSEPAHVVMAVLTDYARIPKFMPDVQVSKVVERTPTGAVVEQEAVSRFMMFSKKVHLILDVREDAGAIRFRDRCRRSFTSYQGGWTITESDSVTVVDYELTARPSFEVPGFVLKRLLKRDAALLIDRIKAEIAAHEIR